MRYTSRLYNQHKLHEIIGQKVVYTHTCGVFYVCRNFVVFIIFINTPNEFLRPPDHVYRFRITFTDLSLTSPICRASSTNILISYTVEGIVNIAPWGEWWETRPNVKIDNTFRVGVVLVIYFYFSKQKYSNSLLTVTRAMEKQAPFDTGYHISILISDYW